MTRPLQLDPHVADPDQSARSSWAPAWLLVAATIVAYLPALQAGFVWDDDDYVVQNSALVDGDGLRRIWFDFGATPQYYPLVHTSFWIEHHLWGLAASGYHATNIVLHALTSVMLWLVLRRLEVPLAGLAAAVFALHPVHVESVAWVTERKNVLSGFCYLSAAYCYLRFAFDEPLAEAPRRREQFYVAATMAFAGALLSKTVTFSLPAALALVLWWKRTTWTRREFISLGILVLATIPPVLATIWLEREHVGASGAEWQLTGIERLLVAGRILWFYPAKLAFPVPLIFIYPRWQIDAAQWWQSAFPLAAIACLAGLWFARGRIGRGPLAAVLFYAGTLVPALGFFNVYPMRYSFVADHFQYLASIGLIVLAVAGLDRLALRTAERHRTWLVTAVAGTLLATLGTLTWRQCGIYFDLPTLWTDTIAKNPACWMAHANLAAVLAGQGKYDAAESHYRESLRINPSNAEAFVGLAAVHSNQNLFDEAEQYFRQAIDVDPTLPVTHFTFGLHYGRRGELGAAAECFQRACELNPRFAAAHFYLGQVWFEQGLRTAAYQQFERTLELAPHHPLAHQQLGIRQLEAGDIDGAIQHLRQSITYQPDLASAHLNLAVALQRKGLHGQAKLHRDRAREVGSGQ